MTDISTPARRAQSTRLAEAATERRWCTHGDHYVPVSIGGKWKPTRHSRRWICTACIARATERRKA